MTATNIPSKRQITSGMYKNKRDSACYICFFINFVTSKNKHNDEHFCSSSLNSPLYNTWSGLAYERICLQHIPAIKCALGIFGVLTNVYSWRQNANEEKGVPGIQIDMLIDRHDQIINLCEIKYSKAEYSISKEYDSALRQRLEFFRIGTRCKKAIHLTMITTYGLTENSYSQTVQNSITMDDLFLC